MDNTTITHFDTTTFPSLLRETGSTYPEITHTVWVPLRIITGLASLFGNALVIAAVVKYEEMRTCTNILICSLASADLITGMYI